MPSLVEISSGEEIYEIFLYSSSIYFRYFMIICPSFEQTGIRITQECFVPSLVEIGQLVLEKIFF